MCNVLIQVIAATFLCISCMNMGIFGAWPSSTILLFKSENTTLQRPMTDIEISFFSSLTTAGSLVGHPIIVGYILDKLGRKYTVMLASSFYTIAWLIIASSNIVEIILPAMFLGGLGVTVFLSSIIYIAEISDNTIRGTLTSGPNLICTFGYLVSYFLGGALEYHMMVYTCLFLALMGVLVIMVLKESPVTLMTKGKEEEAARSIAFYRRTDSTSKEVMRELNSIRRTINSDKEDAQFLTLEAEKVKSQQLSCWAIFKTSPSTRRQFYLVMVLKSAFVCQGLPVVLVYAEPMFAATVHGVISPNLCSVLLGMVTLVTGIISAYFVDKVGRRPLQLYASVVAGICCMIVGTQISTGWFSDWTIPLFVCTYAMAHTVGSGTVPAVVGAEIFLPEVKSVLLMLAAEWLLSLHFGFLFVFNFLVQSAGLSPVFFFFSFMCFASSIYFYYYLPETKGLSSHDIQNLFVKDSDKITPVC